MNNNYEKPFYESRKFQLMMGLVIAAVLKQMGVPVPDEIFWAGLAGIMGVAATDFGKENKAQTEVVSNLEEEVDDQAETIDWMIKQRDQIVSEVLSIAGDATIDKVRKEFPATTPENLEEEFLAYFEERINYYRGKLWKYPDKRFRFDELLEVAEHSLVVAQASVESVKLWQATGGRSGSEPNSLGDIGFRILGIPVPWEK